jgi:hypothetical protein
MSPPEDGARRAARELLATFGADELAIRLTPHSAARDWAESGAMDLTGYRDGPPLVSPGAPASAVRGSLAVFEACTGVPSPGAAVLSERAAIAGLRRNAPFSPGGSFRALAAADGWVGVSLARPSDVDSVAAVIEGSVDDPWTALGRWLANRPAISAGERLGLLGVPAAVIPPTPPRPRRPGVVLTRGTSGRRPAATPIVVDLSALWAGPLCAQLLGAAGARVIKVESRDRPDGARFGPAAFFELMHGGHESVVLDFHTQLGELRQLLQTADVVLESARPRALRQLGFDAEAFVADGAIWASITSYGRSADDEMRVGFGDDVSAGAGLVVHDRDAPIVAGDALADPIAGSLAAAAIALALREETGALIDVSMHDAAVAAANLAGPDPRIEVLRDHRGWLVRAEDGDVRVAPPHRRAG